MASQLLVFLFLLSVPFGITYLITWGFYHWANRPNFTGVSELPPSLPAALPILGHTIPFLFDGVSFVRRATAYAGRLTCVRISLPLAGIYLFQEPEAVAAMWKNPLKQQITKVKTDAGRVRAMTTTATLDDDDYASTYWQQLRLVTYRMFQDYWRDPTYLYSKLALCVGAAFFNGVSFWFLAKDVQGLTCSLFSCFLLTIVFNTVDQQIIPRFIDNRDQFEAREQQSKTYHWAIFVAANMIAEIVWRSLTSVLVFLAWYYPTGFWRNGSDDSMFSMNQRAILIFLLLWVFFIFSSTLSQAFAAGMQDSLTAVNVANLLFTLCLIFCGILAQPDALPRFWIFMYRVSPVTYLMEGMIVAALANTKLHCTASDLVRVPLPTKAVSCGEYMASYVSNTGGQVLNPDTTVGECLFCAVADTNSALKALGIDVTHRWRDLGLLAMYVLVNVVATFFLYWLARAPKGTKKV